MVAVCDRHTGVGMMVTDHDHHTHSTKHRFPAEAETLTESQSGMDRPHSVILFSKCPNTTVAVASQARGKGAVSAAVKPFSER